MYLYSSPMTKSSFLFNRQLPSDSPHYHNDNFTYHNNQYYRQKILDDHRFERRKLEKPGFLIRQEKIYPDHNSYSIGPALDYANNLLRPPSSKFYSGQAEQERIKQQGVNPFYSQKRSNKDINLKSYLKKSSRSRMDTNPNLGVTSYQLLSQTNPPTNSKRQNQTSQLGSSRKQEPLVEDYIAESLIKNFGKQRTNPPLQKEGNTLQQNLDSRQQVGKRDSFEFNEKRNTFNPNFRASSKPKLQSTIVRLSKNPSELIYKGKKFYKLIQ